MTDKGWAACPKCGHSPVEQIGPIDLGTRLMPVRCYACDWVGRMAMVPCPCCGEAFVPAKKAAKYKKVK
jgi:hypothetical protein